MEFKVLMVMLLSVSLSNFHLINCASLTRHQEQGSHGLGFMAVERVKDKDLVAYNEALSGESRQGGEKAAATASDQTMHERSDLTPLFTMDYSRVRKRRPVHNKSFPATTTSP
ncbi:hypothetical protein L2E82_13945 [Cichorium intybus]|uniref:Uncharacterized protein n=1 Tax=Cichorium intybus TaxID=13427 RepID=A0ACB9EZX0_CICIN|nr:hypothetical protein L2E82_13945 [Cichorium intybus]